MVAMKLRGMQGASDTSNRFIRGDADAGRATENSAPVLLAQYFNVLEAMLAKSILESAGIESFLANSNIARLYGLIPNIFGGLKLFVRSDDLEAAKSILEQTPPEKFDVEGFGEYIQPRCPSCQSPDISFDQDDEQLWECHACGRRWKEKDEDPALPPTS